MNILILFIAVLFVECTYICISLNNYAVENDLRIKLEQDICVSKFIKYKMKIDNIERIIEHGKGSCTLIAVEKK